MKKPLSRARARDVDACVAEIIRAMVDGTWTTSRADIVKRLVAREGVGESTVTQWAAEAGRQLRMAPEIETYRGLNVRRLDALANEGEGKTRVAAISEQNRMLGLHAKQEVEITMKAKELEALPPAELLSKVRMQRAKLDEIEAKLLAEHPELRRPEFVPSKKGKFL